MALAGLAVLGLTPAGCGPAGRPSEALDTLRVTVSIVPQKYFVECIGGNRLAVNVMVEPGANPATYEPKPSQLRALDESAAYFTVGVPFEQVWMERMAAVNPAMHIVDTVADAERIPMVGRHSHDEHPHAEEESAAHGQLDPHVWLSPRLVRVQARTICDALCDLDPEHAAEYRAHLASFEVRIDRLDERIRDRLRGTRPRAFLVFHPSWGYFARDYGLEMIPMEVGGQEPSVSELAALTNRARELGVRIVIAQPEFNSQMARALAHEIGAEIVFISPLAADWPDNLRRLADALASNGEVE